MLDLKTIVLIFGIFFLIILLTKKAILKQKSQPRYVGRGQKGATGSVKPKLTAEQFKRSWKSLSYLLFLAAAGNLYMIYNAIQLALRTSSYVYWIDSIFSLAAAIAAVIIWKVQRQSIVFAYAIISILPIFFFMSTGNYTQAILRLFPLVLVYFVVQPVWHGMEDRDEGTPSGGAG